MASCARRREGRDAEAAAAAAERIGGRVAMKAVGGEIHHKTEAGLVLLGVEGAEAAGDAFRLLQERAGAAFEGVLVERMVAGDREFMVGMKRDSTFGPVVVFGLGGVLTEALGDIALAVAPVDDDDAAVLPDLIRARRLLGPFRGYPPVDRDALSAVIQAVGRMALDHPQIAEIDVNPLLIEDGRPVAADALVILDTPGQPRRRLDFHPDLEAILRPRSVAIVGASDDIDKWGGSALRNILDGGFDGAVYPVNPKGGEFFGLPVYAGIDDLPEAPDLALLAVGGRQVVPMVEACGRRGIRAAIAIAAGFSETGDEGAAAEQELARLAADNNVSLIGPNCMGLISNEHSLHALGFIVLHPIKGKLSILSQSGNLGGQIVHACQRQSIGIDKFVSVGNEAQIGAVDLMEALRDDAGPASGMLYLAGIDDGRHFMEAARRTTAVKPVVVLRGGLTEFGGKAAASHTGAMAGSAPVYEAAARQVGVVTCTTTQEAVDLASSLAYLPLPKGRRVAVLTNGGGAGVLMADEIARNGLQLADVPAELIEALSEILPPFWSRRNPLDMCASAGGDVGPRALELVANCDAFDAIVVLSVLGVPNTGAGVRAGTEQGEFDSLSPWETRFMQKVSALMESTGRPIINVPDTPIRGSLFDFGDRYAPVVLSSPAAAGRVLDRMAWYAEYRRKQHPKGE
jgi:acyl-CoA synthetase (NDP forming)